MRRRSGVLAVVVVIAAFLGMHSLAMPTHGASPASGPLASSNPMSMTSHAAVPIADTNASDDATMSPVDAGGANSSDPMVGMACAMALLIVAAGIILTRARVLLTPRHESLRWEQRSPPLVTFTRHPPSLTHLSISRT